MSRKRFPQSTSFRHDPDDTTAPVQRLSPVVNSEKLPSPDIFFFDGQILVYFQDLPLPPRLTWDCVVCSVLTIEVRITRGIQSSDRVFRFLTLAALDERNEPVQQNGRVHFDSDERAGSSHYFGFCHGSAWLRGTSLRGCMEWKPPHPRHSRGSPPPTRRRGVRKLQKDSSRATGKGESRGRGVEWFLIKSPLYQNFPAQTLNLARFALAVVTTVWSGHLFFYPILDDFIELKMASLLNTQLGCKQCP
ncbi:hypothetical protein J3R74_002579 [Puniceicoccus vermicola]